jgi:hypothetical protein
LIVDASAKCILAESQDEVTGLCIRFEVLAHGRLALNPVPTQNTVLEIMTVEKCEVLEINEIIELF